MAKIAIVKASELGDDWRPGKHIKHQMSHVDLECLADIRKKRAKYLKWLDGLDEQERVILRKYLKEGA